MKRPILAFAALSSALPALADDPMVVTRLNGMNMEIEELGVPSASSEQVDLRGVPAIKVTNRSAEIASCQFHALPEETAMTATPAASISPNEEVVMQVPGKYSAGGPIAMLVCKPVGAASN